MKISNKGSFVITFGYKMVHWILSSNNKTKDVTLASIVSAKGIFPWAD